MDTGLPVFTRISALRLELKMVSKTNYLELKYRSGWKD